MVVSAKTPRLFVSFWSLVSDENCQLRPVGVGEIVVIGIVQLVVIVENSGLPLHRGVVLGGDAQFLREEIILGRQEFLLQRHAGSK